MTDMPHEILKALKDLGNPHVERCGYILRGWTITLINNVSAQSSEAFEFDPEQQRRVVEDSREMIMGIFHTHPKGSTVPSQKDIEGWPPIPGLRYWIVTSSEVAEWELQDGKPKLLSRA